MKDKEKDRIFTYTAMGITLLAIVYLAFFLYNAYSTFHEYSDLGTMAYNLYFNLHYPQIASGFQYILFGNHIAPDMLMVLPIFYLYQSSLTVLFLQLAFVYGCGFLVFFIAKDLTKNTFLAMLLCIAFVIYPGNLGLVIFDAHIEFMITFFFLLTFYFYMKTRPYAFFFSSLLLLGTVEVAPLLGIALGIMLMVYEYRYNKNKILSDTRGFFALVLVVLSFVALFFYSYVTSVLLHTTNLALPPPFSITGGIQNGLGAYVKAFINSPITQLKNDVTLYSGSNGIYLAYALMLILFGFGISLFFIPDLAFIVMIPWLSGVFIFQDPSFLFPLNEYFSYITAPILCTAIIGILVSREKDNKLSTFLRKKRIDSGSLIRRSIVIGSVLLSLLAPLSYFLVVSPSSQFHSIGINDISQLLFFQTSKAQEVTYRQLNSIINMVPQNQSLLTEFFTMPHVINREYLDYVPSRLPNATYVLLDFNKNISDNSCKAGFENCTAYVDIVNNGNYTLYAENGTAKLYKRN